MQKSIRKKGRVVSEVSVHDSRIKKLKLKGDELTIVLDRCSVNTEDNDRCECRPAFIRLQKFDKDETLTCCYILNVFGKKKYKILNFHTLAKALKNGHIKEMQITDIYYRYNDIMLIGTLFRKKKMKEFQLRLNYLGDMIFGYELDEESP